MATKTRESSESTAYVLARNLTKRGMRDSYARKLRSSLQIYLCEISRKRLKLSVCIAAKSGTRGTFPIESCMAQYVRNHTKTRGREDRRRLH